MDDFKIINLVREHPSVVDQKHRDSKLINLVREHPSVVDQNHHDSKLIHLVCEQPSVKHKHHDSKLIQLVPELPSVVEQTHHDSKLIQLVPEHPGVVEQKHHHESKLIQLVREHPSVSTPTSGEGSQPLSDHNVEDLSLDDLLMEYNTSYFPPTQRDRIMKRLLAAGKLTKPNLTPLEIIQEKFQQEAHILNKTVIVDDGTERKVYSTCIFENLKRYNCNICITAVYGKTALIRHNSGRKHYYMMQRTTHPHQNFDEHQIVNLDSGMRSISMSDCFIVGELFEQCRRQNIHLVLIGLEYLVEVLDPRDPYYHCLLCNKVSSDIGNLVDHLQGLEHRMFYMLLFFPKVYKKLLLLKREVRWVQLGIIVENIEKKFGRLKPWRHDGALSLKQKRAIRHSIDSGPHIRDNTDLSLAEDIVFNDKVKNTKITDTVITEFVVNESEDSQILQLYERLKGGIFRCKLCRVRVDTLLERVTHPYTGKHMEKTVKGIAIFDSILCQIQSVFESFPQPLIGTEYIVEYQDQGVFLYHCMLCRKAMNNCDMVTSHLVSKAHRQRYIKHHMPKKDEELLKLSGPVRAEEIEKLLKQIEAKWGRLPPYGLAVYTLEHQVDSKTTVKDLIGRKIMDGKHLTVDERGIPKLTYKMPVPLFPNEGQPVPEAGTQSKKKKKKKSTTPRSRSPSPKRRRSQSSDSSRSLSPVARQRRLSPEPGLSTASTSYLPEEVMPPPAFIRGWLNLGESGRLSESAHTREDRAREESAREDRASEDRAKRIMSKLSYEEMEAATAELESKLDEEHWDQRPHDCVPELDSNHPFQQLINHEETMGRLRLVKCREYLKKRLVEELGWKEEDLTWDNLRYRNIVKLMGAGPFPRNLCLPVCKNAVSALVCCAITHYDFVQQMEEEELILGCRGLAHLAHFFHMLWSMITSK